MMGEVVKLPTAARRKVQQRWNKQTRAARTALPQFPGEFIFPGERRMMPIAETFVRLRTGVTLETELLTAICWALDDDARAKAVGALATGAAGDRQTALDAMHILSATGPMTVREQVSFTNAIDRLVGNADERADRGG